MAAATSHPAWVTNPNVAAAAPLKHAEPARRGRLSNFEVYVPNDGNYHMRLLPGQVLRVKLTTDAPGPDVITLEGGTHIITVETLGLASIPSFARIDPLPGPTPTPTP